MCTGITRDLPNDFEVSSHPRNAERCDRAGYPQATRTAESYGEVGRRATTQDVVSAASRFAPLDPAYNLDRA